jgi:hypothetical protein
MAEDGLGGSDHADKAVLGLCIAFNVPLSSLDRAVAYKLLDVPEVVISLAARVTKVRRPEWDEQPSKPARRYKAVNQFTRALAVMCRPREDLITGPSHVYC